MKKFKPWLVLVLVFVAGFAGGVFTTRAIVRQRIRTIVLHPEVMRERIERELTRKLKLTAEQRPRVQEILTSAHDQIKAVRSRFQPEFEVVIEKAHSELAAALTVEQKEKLEKLRAENRRLWNPTAQPKVP